MKTMRPNYQWKYGVGTDGSLPTAMREELADLAHRQWVGWMKYLWSRSHKIFGLVIIPRWAVERWERQMNTEYFDLLESEKESDRHEADRVIDTLVVDKAK